MTSNNTPILAPKGRDTVAQLKADIDSGRTGDKVNVSDPGLSPLGTDDEAAGTPASPARIHTARSEEARIGAAAQADAPKRERAWFIPTLMATLMLVVVVAAVVGLGHALGRAP